MRVLNTLVVGAVLVISILMLPGCSGSKEARNSFTRQLGDARMQVDSLRALNDSLSARIDRLAQEDRLAGARLAELETQLAQMRQARPPAATTASPEESYQQALDSFRQGKYQEAHDAFQEALAAGIDEKLQDNCTYWMGECLYGEKNYQEAIEQFRKVFAYAFSEKKDDAQLMIANSYLALGDKIRARTEYERLIKVFPASPYVQKAKEKLGKL